MSKTNKKIGEIFIDKGLITTDQLQAVLMDQRATKEFLGKILLKKGLITEEDFLQALSEQLGFPFIRLKKEDINIDTTLLFSATLILDDKCVPFKQDDYTVTMAITNPLDAWVLNRAEGESKTHKVKFVLVTEKDMLWLIQQYRRYKSTDIQQLSEEE